MKGSERSKFWPLLNIAILYNYRFDISVYTFLFVSTIFVNKYVLSVLKFTYPTVFQGWQTFVAVVVLKILSLRNKLDVTAFDRNAAISIIPHCFYFVGAIVAGSKALALLPVPVFVCVGNLSGACVFLVAGPSVDRGLVTVTAGLLTLGTAVSIVVLDVSLPFADSGYSWLLAHVAFVMAQVFHARDFSSRYTDMDRLYYSSIFSVVVLAPSSLYLEEAFSALHFQHRRQLRFYAGCALSGLLGVATQLWAARARSEQWSGPARGLAQAVACCLYVPVFGASDVAAGLWPFVAANLAAGVFVPTGLAQDDKGTAVGLDV
ncbi:transmembrane protein 241-like isoform X1 [Bacillus rossius redtenbacheri]|uniref:transmembrane protein 241-like isoform X1 n=1 Tax=Bacillus rossius redtenbacheri TaxID=93214 RepID=UPI002FDC98BD